jgi:hypothetical protein
VAPNRRGLSVRRWNLLAEPVISVNLQVGEAGSRMIARELVEGAAPSREVIDVLLVEAARLARQDAERFFADPRP